jgi:NodT family efflux transporter outer membrane factor (OMF) lipoprotein
MKRVHWWSICGIILLLSGCTVGPTYHPPAVSVPPTWSKTPAGGVTSQPAANTQWWVVFADTTLNTLIDDAVQANLDLRLAAARVREARALRGVTAAGKWPTVESSGVYTRSRSSENVAPQGAISRGDTDLFQLGFDAGWELDVFGGVRRAVEAAEADIAAAEAERYAVLVTLLGEVTRNYVELRGLQRQLAITQANIAAQQETLDLTQARFQAGLSSALDVSRATAQVATTAAEVPRLESALKQTMHRLSTLLGQAPGSLSALLSQVDTLPSPPPEVPAGLPSDLLRRRPDVRRAERQLAAATARIGVATAEIFPRFSLTGLLGVQSVQLSTLVQDASQFWSIGPTIRWPVFQAGRIRANIEVQNARQEQALLRYEQAVLTALEEVENALVAYAKEQGRRQALAAAVSANQRAVELANELYINGLVDFLSVLEAQRSLFSSQSQLVQSDTAVSTDVVALYKALGGGWQADELLVE